MSTTAPVATIHRWLVAGGGCRVRPVRAGIAVDLFTCDGREMVDSLLVPDAERAHVAALLAAADAEQLEVT